MPPEVSPRLLFALGVFSPPSFWSRSYLLITNYQRDDIPPDSRSRKDAPRRDERRENGETSPGAGTLGLFDFLPQHFSSFAVYLLYHPPPFHELPETFSSHKAFTTRIQLTRKASRNFTRRDSTLTLMLPVENCKNCLRRCFFYLIIPYTKINLTRYAPLVRPPRFSRTFPFFVSREQESISKVNLLRQSRETVLKPAFIRK